VSFYTSSVDATLSYTRFFISAVYTTEEVRAKIAESPSASLLPDVPIAAVGPIIDIDVHAEAVVRFLTANNVVIVDLMVAEDQHVARRFENVANVGGLCVNSTILARDFGYTRRALFVNVNAIGRENENRGGGNTNKYSAK